MHARAETSVRPAARGDGKVLRGKDGWLFLDHDENRIMAQHAGEVKLSAGQLDEWHLVLQERNSFLAARGIPYLLVIPPNSHSIYSEMLPDDLQGTGDRPVDQILRHLQASGSDVPVIYPVEELQERKHQNVYAKTDSHWTDRGAFVVYGRLMDELARWFVLPRLTEDDVLFVESPFCGDLGFKVDPPQESPQPFFFMPEAKATITADNRIRNNGRRVEFRREGAALCCLLFGDSFSATVLPYLAESFSRVVFAHMKTLDRELVERERPDVVINLINERFLVRVPDDRAGLSLNELAAEKQATGDVYPGQFKPGNRVYSPM